MSRRFTVASFAAEEDLLSAARVVRSHGLRVADAFAPYAVHGLDQALGLRPSRLTWICAILGLLGAGLMLWFQAWTSAVAWPIDVGGKPWNSLPAFVPVIFESMVLAAGVGTVLAFLAICRLYPGRQPRQIVGRITDDRFALLVEETDARFDFDRVREILTACHATAVEERVIEEPARDHRSTEDDSRSDRMRLNVALLAVLAVLIVFVYAVGHAPARPNFEFLPEMTDSVASNALESNTILPKGISFQRPVPGTVARGQSPLHYTATEEDAVRAGEEQRNPFSDSDPAVRERGALVFRDLCACCHGSQGRGDGPVALHGFPPPPSLIDGKSREMKDGTLLHTITYGRKNMPAQSGRLSRDDRWKVIVHIRTLQAAVNEAGSKKVSGTVAGTARDQPSVGARLRTTVPDTFLNPATKQQEKSTP